MGAGDDIPTVLRQLGLDVTLLTPEDVEHGDLQRFGTIVLGIRAYDTREDVKKNNQRLLDYARDGGTLMVQYNTEPADFNNGELHALSCPTQPGARGGGRVAGHDPRSQESRVPLSQSDRRQPIFQDGCRSAACTSWTSGTRNTRRCWPATIRASRRKRAACLLAPYGKGYYIYNAYAFFRQLPFGVPGRDSPLRQPAKRGT